MSRQEDLIEANNRGLLTGQVKEDFDLAVSKGLISIEFDPEGSGYDYKSARDVGLEPDETGHWPSRNPQTGQLLKGRGHETFSLTEQGEKEAGFEIFKGEDDKYYSKKIEQPQFDIPTITESILKQYDAGTLTDRKVAILDQLKKRGAFDAPQYNVKGLKESAEYAGETISNIPGSAYRVGEDIYTAVRHPIETAKGVGKLALGGIQKLVPGEQGFEYIAEDFGEMVKERYGSVENIAESFKKDPVGVAGDFATLLTGVGAGLKFAKLGKFGEAVSKVGASLEPMTGVGKIAKGAVKKGLMTAYRAKSPADIYQSAVKFSTTLNEVERLKLADTALKSGIMPTYEGLQKAWGKVNDLNTKITDLIDKAQETGKKITVKGLFKEFDDLELKALSDSSLPIDAAEAIEKVKYQITEANNLIDRKALTPKEAQRLKQKTYKELEQYYKKNLETPPTAEARKSVARQARLFLEEVIPEIKQLNRAEGDYLALINALDRPVSRISNRDLFGIGVPIKATAGGALGGKVGAAVGTAFGVLDNPKVKARLAIMLHNMEKQGIILSPKSSATLSAIYGASKAETK